MSDPTLLDTDPAPTGMDVLEDAFLAAREVGLRLPPVPHELVDRIDEFADGPGFLAAASDPATPPRVAFGNIGHRVSSWWSCYQLVNPALALFVRLPFGGINRSDDATKTTVNGTLYRAEELIALANRAHAAGKLGGQRLIVVLDDLEGDLLRLPGQPEPVPDPQPLQTARAAL